ncbi:hypothetical protein WN51_10292 [Melipona quadrifasciata]|uniref:Uncharacterized protein n=1 Tax=Melipona quadrifasciata TaxID=166423 RepID=A0A0N0U684_9HYME|nr:hypothetical protein WN51_10292 [Melipona quadrifasciata]
MSYNHDDMILKKSVQNAITDENFESDVQTVRKNPRRTTWTELGEQARPKVRGQPDFDELIQ